MVKGFEPSEKEIKEKKKLIALKKRQDKNKIKPKLPSIYIFAQFLIRLLLFVQYVTTSLTLSLTIQTSSGSRRGLRANERRKGGQNSSLKEP